VNWVVSIANGGIGSRRRLDREEVTTTMLGTEREWSSPRRLNEDHLTEMSCKDVRTGTLKEGQVLTRQFERSATSELRGSYDR